MMTDIDEVREKIAEYLRTHSREGDCPCEKHQAQMYEWADQILDIPITVSRVCPQCGGEGKHAYAGTEVPIYIGECITCQGTGHTEVTKTIREILEEAVNGKV